MGLFSSLFKPNIRSIQDAERVTFRWFYVGFLAIGAGLGLTATLFLSPVGIALIVVGSTTVLITIAWLVAASRRNTVVKNCPRCDRPNSVYREEAYFKCASCGYFAILREV